MPKIAKDKGTSTATSMGTSFQQNCVGCPRSSSNSTSATEYEAGTSIMDVVTKSLVAMDQLQKDIMRIEREQDKTRDFYKGIAKLTKVSRIAIIALMIVPVLQLIACTATVYYLGIQEELSGLLTWILSSVSILSLIEVGITALKYFALENKIDDFEKRLDNLEGD